MRGRPEAAAVVWSTPVDDGAARASKARRRAVLQGVVAGAAGAALFFWLGHRTVAYVAWSIGGLSMLAGLASPLGLFAGIERAVGALGQLVGTIMTWLLLAPVYLLFLTPFGLLARRGDRDALRRAIDEGAPTYWKTRDADAQRGSLDKPY